MVSRQGLETYEREPTAEDKSRGSASNENGTATWTRAGGGGRDESKHRRGLLSVHRATTWKLSVDDKDTVT